MDKEILHQQIHKYFEAELTQQEEKALLKTLLKMEGKHAIADEALAVMLASRTVGKVSKTGKRITTKLIAGIAASLAIILSVGVLVFHHPQNSQTFAYVSGKKIYDHNEINNIVATQLQDIQESTGLISQTLSSDFNDIREALIADEI